LMPAFNHLEEERDTSVEARASTLRGRKHPWPENHAEQIWAEYGKPVDKKAGLAALDAIRRADRVAYETVLNGVREQVRHVEPKYRPSLERWLKKERWNDHYPVGPPRPSRPIQNGNVAALKTILEQKLPHAPFAVLPIEPASAIAAIPFRRDPAAEEQTGGGSEFAPETGDQRERRTFDG
jgi:hypothetical protein